MSKENAKAFVQAILDDEELRKRTEKMKPEDAVPLGKEMGYDFTLEEFTDVMNEDRELSRELSPDELEAVAGGYEHVQRDMDRWKGFRMDHANKSCHCYYKLSNPLHNYVLTGHVEEPVLWGIFGDYTKGYDVYECSRCKVEMKIRT